MKKLIARLSAAVTVFFVLAVIVSLSSPIVMSQAIDVGGDAPDTTNVVNNALANGKTPEEAAQAGADYLNNLNRGYSAWVVKRPDGTISVECNNGARVDIPSLPPLQDTGGSPMPTPPQAPPPPTPNPCEIYPAGCIELPPVEPPEPTSTTTPTPPPATPTRVPTPTRIPSACGFQCTRDSDCQADIYSNQNVCTVCINNVCQVPPTPTPSPTPTPTPSPTPTPIPFNPAACKCDGIEYSNLFSGQTATITSFGKVEGEDVNQALIADQTFYLAEGGETIAKIIGRSEKIPSTVVSTTAQKVRYQSKWIFTLPQLKSGATYRIWSQINCQPKNQPLSYSPKAKTVLGADASQPKSFIQKMLDFLNSLFSGSKTAVTTSAPTPTPEKGVGTGIILEEPSPETKKSLQLETIYPVEVYDKSCSFIKFRYSAPNQ